MGPIKREVLKSFSKLYSPAQKDRIFFNLFYPELFCTSICFSSFSSFSFVMFCQAWYHWLSSTFFKVISFNYCRFPLSHVFLHSLSFPIFHYFHFYSYLCPLSESWHELDLINNDTINLLFLYWIVPHCKHKILSDFLIIVLTSARWTKRSLNLTSQSVVKIDIFCCYCWIDSCYFVFLAI